MLAKELQPTRNFTGRYKKSKKTYLIQLQTNNQSLSNLSPFYPLL